MRRQIQVHFENGGQLVWNEEVEEGEEEEYLRRGSSGDGTMSLAKDEETNRYFTFNLDKVTAIILMKDPKQDDLMEKVYAPKERQEQVNNRFEYSGDGGVWSRSETGGGCCPFPS